MYKFIIIFNKYFVIRFTLNNAVEFVEGFGFVFGLDFVEFEDV